MDHILERLNVASSRITEDNTNMIYMNDNVKALINKRNLKLHDINKEIEYNQISLQLRQVEQIVPQLWSSVILFATILIFKVTNSVIESRLSSGTVSVGITSSTVGSTASTSYYEALQLTLSMLVIYMIKKVKYKHSYVLVMLLICAWNILIVTKFYIDQHSPLIQIQFLFTIAFSFCIRLTSVFFVSIVCMISCIAFLQIRLSVIVQDSNEQLIASSTTF